MKRRSLLKGLFAAPLALCGIDFAKSPKQPKSETFYGHCVNGQWTWYSTSSSAVALSGPVITYGI